MSKVKRVGLVGLVFLFVAVITPAFGLDWTEVEGQGQILAVRSHGTDNVGGEVGVDAVSQFSAKGFHKVSGSLDMESCLIGDSMKFGNFGFSWNKGSLTSQAQAKGLLTDVKIQGSLGQDNWVLVGSPTNYAAGQSSTSAEYNAESKGWGPKKVEGGALVGGMTLGFVIDKPYEKLSFVTTKGDSLSWLGCGGVDKVIAKGEGYLQVQSSLFKPGFAAIANGSGQATYFSSGSKFASGSFDMTARTSVNLFPNGIKLSSSVTAKSSAK